MALNQTSSDGGDEGHIGTVQGDICKLTLHDNFSDNW